jgi:ketosteroid isomerase-like protein
MPKYRIVVLLSVMACLVAGVFSMTSVGKSPSQTSENGQAIWNLEHEYWRHVQENDLPGYLTLWHKDFLGWPWVSPAPVRKNRITDWITAQTSQGLAFKAVELKPAAIQITGDMAVAYYWMTYKWQDKDGKGSEFTIRVTHTWLKDGKDWRIIGGMSMLEPATPRN